MQMKCKYHANKLLPGGAGLRAEGAGRGLLSRDPFLGGGSLSPDRPHPPAVLITQPGHFRKATVVLYSPLQLLPRLPSLTLLLLVIVGCSKEKQGIGRG